MTLTDDIDDLDVLSADVEEMDAAVTIVSTLEILTGILGLIYVMMQFSAGFFPVPLAVIIAYIAIGIMLGVLASLSVIAGIGLWQLKTWAWRTALAANVAALVLYAFSLSIPLILLNAILVWYLRTQSVMDIYSEIQTT